MIARRGGNIAKYSGASVSSAVHRAIPAATVIGDPSPSSPPVLEENLREMANFTTATEQEQRIPKFGFKE